MAEEAVVDTGTPVAPEVTDQPKPTVTQVQAPAPVNSGWEAEKKAFIADLQKERRVRQQYEQQVATRDAELAAERRRVQALAGVNPQSPEEAEHAEIKARFAQLYPDIAGLTKEDIEAIRELRSHSEELRQTTNNYWSRQAKSMLGSLEKAVADELGGELTPRQVKALKAAYVLNAQEDPEFLSRHEDGDETLIESFAKEWIEDWLKPARRKVTAEALGQARRVPSGRDRSVVQQPEKKIDVNDPKAVEDVLVAGFRERGGEFGRRR